MPLGALLDQWEIFKQFHGLVMGKTELFVDDLIPSIA